MSGGWREGTGDWCGQGTVGLPWRGGGSGRGRPWLGGDAPEEGEDEDERGLGLGSWPRGLGWVWARGSGER